MTPPPLIPRLGLVCNTDSHEVRYRTITRKTLLQNEEPKQQLLLDALYRENLQRLGNAINYCRREKISLYRIPSSLFPFSDEAIGLHILTGMADALARVGRAASGAGIRMVMHPDQFVVLSSDSPTVVANSIKILSMHATIMDLLDQPQSAWALLEVHGGKSGRAGELVERIAALPDPIRLRLGLENDEYAYSAEEIWTVCRASGVPMVFDAHHHIVHESLTDYEDASVRTMLEKARSTWSDPSIQLVHMSNGRDRFGDRRHADYIDTMPSCYADVPWIEVEAKGKELAIRQLRERWGPLQF
jgi:UV DNA damage endonuclease